MPYIGKSPLHGNYQKLDSISGSFDGSTTQFALTQNSAAITPVTEAALIISINGVLQEPVTTYTVSGTNITFTSAPASTDTFFGVVLGEQLAIGTPSDSTVTTAKLASTVFTGATDIGAAIVDADLFLMDDGAGGTIRKTTASRLKTYIGGSDPASADGDSLGTASLEWSDLYLADGSVIYFGDDQEITLTHVADSGITLKNTKTADDAGSFNLTLQSGETDIAQDDILGKILFSAPDEATGTDAILTAAAIAARSEGDFSSSSNATSLDFMLGVSETASTKMTLNSSGNLSVGDGTAALPSYSNVGDLNTGVYFPAADTVGVTVGGTEQFRFGSNPVSPGFLQKNMVINGSMRISQRPTQTGQGGSTAYTAVDQFKLTCSGTAGRVTTSQAVGPSGTGAVYSHANALKIDVTTADGSVAAGDIKSLDHNIEAQHCQHLRWGDSTAQAVTLQFWVKSPKSGIHTVGLYQSDDGRTYLQEYTVASADTWEQFKLTFSGDTGGTVDNNNGSGIIVRWALIAGSNEQGTAGSWTGSNIYATSNQVNVLDSTSNDFYLTGVQLEVGSVATDFEHKDLSTEFVQCLRYYRRITHTFGQAAMPVASVRSDENQKSGFPLEPPMRAGPSLETSGNANDYNMNHGNGNTVCDAVPSLAGATSVVAALRYQTDGGPSAGFASQLEFLEGSGAGFLGFSAEL